VNLAFLLSIHLANFLDVDNIDNDLIGTSFSHDVLRLAASSLSDSVRMFSLTIASIVGATILVSILLPWFLIPVAFVMLAYVYAAYFYRFSAREIMVMFIIQLNDSRPYS
jgi:hypothetical protein